MASSVASKKAPWLVVAASMGAVEALKDQAGLCRWDYALRSLYHRAAASRIHALSVSLSKAAPTTGKPSTTVGALPRRPASAEDVRLHKAYHLVCWGPN